MTKMRKVLAFDDVLLVPKHNPVPSRSEVSLATSIAGLTLDLPIVGANMSSVCGSDMARVLADAGGVGVLHRMCSVSEQVAMVQSTDKENVGAAIGIGADWQERADACVEAGANLICIDVAHGDQDRVVDVAKAFLQRHPVGLVVGNIATGSAAQFFVDQLPEAAHERVALKAGVGGGCFAGNTRVLMSNGFYKNIEEIEVGDRVINKYGFPVSVKRSWKTGYKKVSKLRTNVFYEDTFVTPDHRYWVGDLSTVSKSSLSNQGYKKTLEKKRRGGRSKFGWKKIAEGKEDALLLPRKIQFELADSFPIPLYKRSGGNGHSSQKSEVDATLAPNYELGYILGTFLGDGCAHCPTYKKSRRGQVNWYFGLGETEIAEKLRASVEAVFGKELSITKRGRVLVCTFYYKPLADLLFQFGKKSEKHLPQPFLVEDLPYLRGLYEGLLDSDGHVDGPRETFSNTSTSLIELNNVLHYLVKGYFPNNSKPAKSVGGLKGATLENFKQPYQTRSLGTPDRRLLEHNQIVKVLEYGGTSKVEVPVYDIEVGCPTHSFIAANAIVHNSVCTTRIRTGFGLPTLQSVLDISQVLNDCQTPMSLIADGGLKNSGDICKALAGGSNAVMLGSLLAGTDEAPGDVVKSNGQLYKVYAGSASHGAKKHFFGKAEYVEGAERLVPYKGSAKKILQALREGVSSGFTYCGAKILETFQAKADFVQITAAGYTESIPHGLL